MIIKSKEDLRSYVLKRLGYPVITINIEESQLQDRLDDALEFFQLYSDDGQVKTYTKHIITEEEISDHLLQIPDDVIAITQIYPTDGAVNPSWYSPEYQSFIRELKDLQTGVLDGYYIVQRHLSLMNWLLGTDSVRFVFSENSRTVSLQTDWSKFTPNESFLLIESYNKINSTKYPAIWNSYWIKELAYYYCLRQWATNLKKYSNVPLPGGVTLNAAEMLDEANQKLTEIQDKMKVVTDPPAFFMVG